MATQSCACKGIRTCLLCEKEERPFTISSQEEYYMCYNCGNICKKENTVIIEGGVNRVCCSTHCDPTHILKVSDHVINEVIFGGVVIIKNFITKQEEAELVTAIDSTHWMESQSGRKKQDYGPKVNFKKQKIKTDIFFGLPLYAKPILDKLDHTHLLTRPFIPVELCNLDYDPRRGSSIDPHFDDNWLWGEHLITLNLLSSTYLSFTHPTCPLIIHVPHPHYSLVIIKDHARYTWKHSIQREHVTSRRIAMTFRELSKEFCKGGLEEEKGHLLLSIARNFI